MLAVTTMELASVHYVIARRDVSPDVAISWYNGTISLDENRRNSLKFAHSPNDFLVVPASREIATSPPLGRLLAMTVVFVTRLRQFFLIL